MLRLAYKLRNLGDVLGVIPPSTPSTSWDQGPGIVDDVEDALHLASAEAGEADYFLTTDDHLLRRASRRQSDLKVKVENPAQWIIQRSSRDEN